MLTNPKKAKNSSRSFEDEVVAFEPDEVLDMLVEGWHDDDKLTQLARLIGEYLQKKKPQPRPSISNGVANPAPTIPTFFNNRRRNSQKARLASAPLQRGDHQRVVPLFLFDR